MSRYAASCFLAFIVVMTSRDVVSGELEHTRLFHSGDNGYPRYRIPSLVVSARGTVLAICEGRKDGGGLGGDVDLVARRSKDNGRTWQPLQVVADAGKDALGNPCSVLDRDTGFVWIAFTRSPGEHSERTITKGISGGHTLVFVTHSEDDGKTWSRPRDISATTRRDDWTWYGTGPGVGIQLRDGRLFIPSYHAEGKDGMMKRSHCIFSDDHGKTWQLGGSAGQVNGECQALQKLDGTIYLSARTSSDGPLQRSIITSKDNGRTWSRKRFDKSLYDSHCQASLLRLPSKKPQWLYCCPVSPKRHDLSVRLSLDEGTTWREPYRLRPGNGQYSSLAVLPDGEIGCLYDCWEDNNYQLYFTRFTVDVFDGKSNP